MIDMTGFVDMVSREAMHVFQAFQRQALPLTVTSYDPQNHAVKGILKPSGIETGWIPVITPHATNNAGILVGPQPGDADSGDGADVFSISFDQNDPNSMQATHRIFSDKDKPPVVQAGEVLMQHVSGSKVFLDQNGQVLITRPDGAKVMLKQNGDSVAAPKPGGIHYSGGDPDDGGTFDWVVTVSGPSTTHKAKIS